MIQLRSRKNSPAGRAADPDKKQFRILVLLFVGIMGLMVLAGMTAFLLSIRGAEKTVVPDLAGKSLETALLDLQEKQLNSRIQLHYSSDPGDKGTVLGQDPKPGALVRSSSSVVLKVSRGAIIDRVEDYIGWKLSDLDIHLQTLFTTHGPLLRIKRPVMKVFDESEPGTILEQKPEPGTEISGLTDIELVVSRGPKEETFTVAAYDGMDYRTALERLIALNQPFVFFARPAEGDESTGVVVSQDPSPGSAISPSEPVELVMTEVVDVPEGHIFGVLERTLPDYPIAVDLTLEAVGVAGDREELLSMKHPGGRIGIPYVEEENTMLVVSIFGREIISYTVHDASAEEETEETEND
jgi:eukaryotic-like serine/threonine-protein kinase